MKSWIETNDIEMHLTNNKEKSVAAERFIRNLNNKIYRYMTSIPKSVYIDRLDDIANKYNNTQHSTIKTKPVNVNPNIYNDFDKENNEKSSNFKVGDLVRI